MAQEISAFSSREIVVLGGGNSAFATAASLALIGHQVRLLEMPEFSESIQAIREDRRIELEAPGLNGALQGRARLSKVTTDPAEAMDGAEVIFFVVPAYGEEPFTRLCMPYISTDQMVVFFCGNFGGALAFAHSLFQAGRDALPLILETDGLYYGGFKSSVRAVRLSGLKAGLAAAALPASRTQAGLERLNAIFPNYSFAKARNVIETGLRNMNPMLHPAISVLNAGRTDPEKQPFLYYKDGVTRAVGELVQAVDEERLRVGKALGLKLLPLHQTLLSWYGWQGASGESLHTLLTTNPAYQTATSPAILEHRFITEDVPYGLVPLSELGKATDTPTPVIDALVTLAGCLLGRDLWLAGRRLASLGFVDLQPAELIAYVEGAVPH